MYQQQMALTQKCNKDLRPGRDSFLIQPPPVRPDDDPENPSNPPPMRLYQQYNGPRAPYGLKPCAAIPLALASGAEQW